ncbi:MAG TPA: hypothetical protein VD861_19050 [Pyrinomonadaceae bacterium]|nr:hypothetical protein [Pyrinomonadaceae bacterium]
MKTQTRGENDAPASDEVEIEPISGQPVLEAEKNLTGNTTADSSPPVGEEEETTVPLDERRRG